MIIGIPKETKDHEYRVAVTPDGAAALMAAGHAVRVQTGAATRIGLTDDAYRAAGAQIVADAAAVYEADLIIKVKEPQTAEISLLRPGQILFGYLHLAADPQLTAQLLDKKIIGIGFETITDTSGTPLLAPMSAVAGRIAVQAGAQALTMAAGGNGTLLPGVAGVAPGKVAIIGAGMVGSNAARVAVGMGADVTLLDRNMDKLRHFDDLYQGRLKTRYSDAAALAALVADADLVIGAVLLPGKKTPKLITRHMLSQMRPGSVLVDVSIDQGGSAETSRPTSHSQPTYIEAGVVHYCVTNMPAACARTATQALASVVLPYALKLAQRGMLALMDEAGFLNGLNVYQGAVTHQAVAEDLALSYTDPATL
ncbi:alanine dehydrogenase [Sulfuriferula sp.]|uniref:alanine dehydrogenase n=1 Tax=Sulfuriferula sp. TaxID=2025307 RepID=UPI00272F46D1|nr:alanine dehydrogenase [Sulfuriferula sp.]MDP2026513.1 alanine dehydrogenase [Sulfuriferula sp.]